VRRPRLRLSLLAAALVSSGVLIFSAAPASAGALSTMTWSVSNNQAGAANVTYSYAFKTFTSNTIKTIDFAVSGAGPTGVPTVSRAYGVGAGTVARAGNVITYTVTAGTFVQAGVILYFEFGALTNPASGSYTTTITTKTAAPANIDTGTTPAVAFAGSNTAISVAIAKSLTFTVDTAAFELDMDPSLAALADQTQNVGLTVQTNANSGYTLTVSDNAAGLQSSDAGNPVIADVSPTGKAGSMAWPGAPKFGYTVTGTGATIDAAFTGSKYAGYVGAGEQIASRANATGGTADTITIANRVAIDYSVPSGVYTDTLTYTVTPNYT
jgi:hypothetical protein